MATLSFFRSVSFGLTAETPTLAGPGIALSEPSPPFAAPEEDTFLYELHGSCRVGARDIEVERTEVLRGIVLTIVFPPAQVPMSAPLVGATLLFPDDVADVGGDLVGSFRCEIHLPSRVRVGYVHAAFRHRISNVVRLTSGHFNA